MEDLVKTNSTTNSTTNDSNNKNIGIILLVGFLLLVVVVIVVYYMTATEPSPPAVKPPAGTPAVTPAVTPPAVTPPAVTPPAVTPPAVTPPAVTPPAVTPPAVTPPAVTPPAVTPPAVTPPAVTNYIKYNPRMYGNQNPSKYTITSSTTYKDSTTNYDAYKAFDYNIDSKDYKTGWHSGAKTYDEEGNGIYGNQIQPENYDNPLGGEWVQIKFGDNDKLYPISKFMVYLYDTGEIGKNREHKKIYLVGSQDEITWDMVYDSYKELKKEIEYQVVDNKKYNKDELICTNKTAYKYYRYIINKMPKNDYAVLNELILYVDSSSGFEPELTLNATFSGFKATFV